MGLLDANGYRQSASIQAPKYIGNTHGWGRGGRRLMAAVYSESYVCVR